MAAPAGDFFLDQDAQDPVVLVSDGVGLTPMVSMLAAVAAKQPERPVWYVHGALNGQVHALRNAVRALAAAAPGSNTRVFYAEPLDNDRLGADYDERGLITADWLAEDTPSTLQPIISAAPSRFCATSPAGWRGTGCRASGFATSSSGLRTIC